MRAARSVGVKPFDADCIVSLLCGPFLGGGRENGKGLTEESDEVVSSGVARGEYCEVVGLGRVLPADADGDRRTTRTGFYGMGGGELDEVANADVGLSGDVREVAAKAFEAFAFRLSAFVSENEGAIACSREAVVEGGADGCSSRICALAVGGESFGQCCRNLRPDGWAFGDVLGVAAKDVVEEAEEIEELALLDRGRYVGDDPGFLFSSESGVAIGLGCAGSHEAREK